MIAHSKKALSCRRYSLRRTVASNEACMAGATPKHQLKFSEGQNREVRASE
jgi:hypothetical protein